jgi:hypothetical protein
MANKSPVSKEDLSKIVKSNKYKKDLESISASDDISKVFLLSSDEFSFSNKDIKDLKEIIDANKFDNKRED